jgi:hypothetical protein
MLTSNHKHPVFLKSLFGVATILSFGFDLTLRGIKEKKDFIHSKGKIIYYADNYPDINRPYGKHKYVIIDSYNRLFELAVLEKQTDKYKFKYDDIKIGDTIDTYFDEDNFAADKRTNMCMYFIDKNGQSIFIYRPNDTIPGICFIGFGLSIMIILIILRQKGKII